MDSKPWPEHFESNRSNTRKRSIGGGRAGCDPTTPAPPEAPALPIPGRQIVETRTAALPLPCSPERSDS